MPDSLLDVLIAALFLLPGFVVQGTIDSRPRFGALPTEKRDAQDFVLRALLGSLVVHAIVIAWTFDLITRVERLDHWYQRIDALELVAYAGVVVVAIPALIGVVLAVVVTQAERRGGVNLLIRLLGGQLRQPGAWEELVDRASKAASFLILTTRDGQILGGLFSSESLATLDPPELLIENEWFLEDGVPTQPTGRPMWIAREDITAMRVVHLVAPGPSGGS